MHKIGLLILISWSYSKGVSTRHKLNKIHLFAHLFHWDLFRATLCLAMQCYYHVQHPFELVFPVSPCLSLSSEFAAAFWLSPACRAADPGLHAVQQAALCVPGVRAAGEGPGRAARAARAAAGREQRRRRRQGHLCPVALRAPAQGEKSASPGHEEVTCHWHSPSDWRRRLRDSSRVSGSAASR